jgi:hypothetical protein
MLNVLFFGQVLVKSSLSDSVKRGVRHVQA